jgi:UDP-N-acetylmuramyl pentapeptide synthase
MQLAYVYAAAAVIGEQFSVPTEVITKQLAEHLPPPGRMRLIPGIKNTLLLDDTYNSSPVAVESALHTMNELKVKGRKIAVLGDMLELGSYSVQQHTRIGTMAAKLTDVLFTVGVRSRATAQAALESGLPEDSFLQYDSAERAGKELQQWLEPSDVVLVKGSQSIRLERVVEEVMQDPEQASELLVRQNKEWLKRR